MNQTSRSLTRSGVLRRVIFVAAMALLSSQPLQADLPDEEAILKKGGKDAAAIVGKAWEILRASEVFASRGVGESGEPTSSCWALTVIVRHDPGAKDSFTRLVDSMDERSELRMYAIAGLLELEPKVKERLEAAYVTKFSEIPVEVLYGCVGEVSTLGLEVYKLLSYDSNPYLFIKLPSLYSTFNVRSDSKGK